MDKDVKNIGIIATYGAGKSSLLKTYDAHYFKGKKITISLANFNDYAGVEVDDRQTTNKNSQLDEMANVKDIECKVEKSILEQFLFSESKMLNSQNFYAKNLR